ncbi:acetylglutamate kinase [Candidatus Gottesmanbacteria bacterium]|nr:acetylglutamate kinase [Candidatus Gottesmanbacteria bacterium]
MKNNIWVIKLGGRLLLHNTWVESLMKVIKLLINKDKLIIIVHGGGPQADDVQKKMGIPIKKINGRRITDVDALFVVKMVYAGSVNKDLVAKALKHQILAVGISGVDAKLAQVTKRPKKLVVNQATGATEKVDFGYVGDVLTINKDMLEYLLRGKYVPVIACLGVDGKGQIFNINADSLATAIACQIGASNLIFITDVNGILKQKGSTKYFQRLTLKQAKKMIVGKKITDGMIPKIENVEVALKSGIENVHIVGALQTYSQWSDALIKQTYGTVIYGENYEG